MEYGAGFSKGVVNSEVANQFKLKMYLQLKNKKNEERELH
jgi:hypothetical protein